MAKQYKVAKIEFNQKMAGKYDGAYLTSVGIESDKPRKDFVFQNSKQFNVLKDLVRGDIIELKITKNGDYYNLAKDDDAIKVVEKAGGTDTGFTSSLPQAAGQSTIQSKPAYSGGFTKDPEVQNAIIRQNGLTNAVNLVTAMLEKGIFPAKVTSEVLVMECTRIAAEFAKFSSGQSAIEELTKEEKPTKKVKADEEGQPSDSEFGE